MSGTNGNVLSGSPFGHGLGRAGYPTQQQHPSAANVNKTPSSLTQHSQYQQQHQQQQQQQQQTYNPLPQSNQHPYPPQIFSSAPSQQVSNGLPSQNVGVSRPPPHSQGVSTLHGSRQPQRGAASRHLQSQPISYFGQPLSQSMNALGSQQLTQQSLGQPAMAQHHQFQQPLPLSQHMNHHSPQHSNSQQLGQQQLGQQQLGQQQLGQQQLGQSQLGRPQLGQQPMNRPAKQNDVPLLPQQPIQRPPSQPALAQSTLPPTASQPSQTQQAQQAQLGQHAQQAQLAAQHAQQSQLGQHAQQAQLGQHVQQQPTPPQPEHAEMAQVHPAQQQNEDDVDMLSREESVVESIGSPGQGSPKQLEHVPFVPRAPMGPILSAPPEGGSFASLDILQQFALNYCTSVGYAVVIGRSKKTSPGLKKVMFVCDRGGKPPKRLDPEQRKRKTTSRKCECEFGFFAIEQRTQWTIRYRPDHRHLVHNHDPSDSPMNHPAARKLTSRMVAAVKELKDNGKTDPGVNVQQTLEILREEHPDVPLLSRDIYNARAALVRQPEKVVAGVAEDEPTIYSKPHPSREERIREELRREIARGKEELAKEKEQSSKKIADLEAQVKDLSAKLDKYEVFIKLVQERVPIPGTKPDDGIRRGGSETNGLGAT